MIRRLLHWLRGPRRDHTVYDQKSRGPEYLRGEADGVMAERARAGR